MGVSACYSDSGLDTLIVELPRVAAPDSKPYDADESDIHLETERGVSWDYHQFDRATPSYEFLVSTTQLLATFKLLHDLVGGHTAFYFVFDVDESPRAVLHCKKEKGFHPVPVGLCQFSTGLEQGWRYTLALVEEITSVDVED